VYPYLLVLSSALVSETGKEDLARPIASILTLAVGTFTLGLMIVQ